MDFFTSNVLLIQVYLRSGNSQRLVAVVFPVYKPLRIAHYREKPPPPAPGTTHASGKTVPELRCI